MLQSTATPISGTSADRSLSPEPEYSEPVSLARTSSLRSFRASHSVTVRKDCEGNKFINNYQVLDDLGSGAYSKVKLVQNVDDGTLYALKILHKAELRKMGLGESNGLLKVQREIAILRKLDHPNIIQLFEVIDDVRCHKIYLVLEYAEFGSLMSLDRFGKVCADEHGCRTISEENARKFMRSLTSALRYAHENGVIHRDIKPENILLTESGDVKLTDFGVSMFLRTPNFFYCQSQSTTQSTTPLDPAIIEPALYEKPSDLVFCDETLSGTSCKGRTNSHHSNISLCSLEHNSGRENITLSEDFLSNSCDAVNLDEMYSECLEIQGTPAFLAPELLGEPRYIDLRLVDAWALSVTLFTLLFGQLPFLANTASEMAMSIINDVVVIPPAEYEEAAEKPVSEELRAFLVQVLQKDPAQRLSITEMMDHPWLTEDSLVPPSPRGTRPRIQVNDAFIASAIRQGWDIDLRTLQNNHPHARRRSSSVASSNVHPRFTSTDDMNSLDTCSDASEAAVITIDYRKTDGVLHHLYPSKHASHRTVLSEDASEPIQGPLDRQKINSWHPHLLARRANKKGRSRAVTFGCAS